MGARIDRCFEEFFSIMALNNTQTINTSFYWNKLDNPSEYSTFRVPSDDVTRRNMEDISAEEISNGIRCILQNQISLLRGDLIKEVWKLFGFSRGSAAIEQIINESIDLAVRRKLVKVDRARDRIVAVE